MVTNTALIKKTHVLVDDNTGIISSVTDYAVDPSTIPAPFKLRLVFGDYNAGELIGKVWNEDGTIQDPPFSITWEDFRISRDNELTKTDWTQVNDAPVSPEQALEVMNWRQSLRDLPQLYVTPEEAYAQLQVLIGTKPI